MIKRDFCLLLYDDNSKQRIVVFHTILVFRHKIRQLCSRIVLGYKNFGSQIQFPCIVKTLFYVNIIKTPEQNIFFDKRRSFMSYPQIIIMMKKGYVSSIRQAAVHAKLKGLQMDELLKKNSIELEAVYLKTLVSEMNALA